MSATVGLAIASGTHRAQRAERDGLAVSEFLVRLLDRAQPDALGTDATLVAALDAAEQDFERTFAGHANAEARVRMAYARANAQLGRWSDVERHAERALRLIAALPEFHPGSAEYCRELLARARGRSP